jgi:hypothetical protein
VFNDHVAAVLFLDLCANRGGMLWVDAFKLFPRRANAAQCAFVCLPKMPPAALLLRLEFREKLGLPSVKILGFRHPATTFACAAG